MDSPVQELAGSAVSDDRHLSKVVSAQALREYGNKNRESQTRDIFEIVRSCQLSGVKDMTGKEISREYERRYGVRMDPGFVSARCGEMIAAGRLARRLEPRACAISGKQARPVYVPPHQARLVA